jgi:hypothetical protein
LVKTGEVVEQDGERGVVRAVRSLVDSDSVLKEKLGRAVVAGSPIEGDQLVERRRQRKTVARVVHPVDGGGTLGRSLDPASETAG